MFSGLNANLSLTSLNAELLERYGTVAMTKENCSRINC